MMGRSDAEPPPSPAQTVNNFEGSIKEIDVKLSASGSGGKPATCNGGR